MPTYDYECEKCGHTFEHFQQMSDAPLKRCPECKKHGLRKLLGAGAGLIFKGSGFYTTDYRSDSYQKGAKSDKAASKSASTKKSSDKKSSSSSKPAKK